ncbi:hypothetical protein [Nocardia sp. CDC160]|uniref:hypothetical protein n=1 Tax=Nocardia sp. CDC160 TaxID=3112166 RepID=UPI002DB9B0F3|nr:hypothetical protein [Nocardia sp. CDC160]MEC3919332.1 hypothetical protein [Nocardia sp. CDC160]
MPDRERIHVGESREHRVLVESEQRNPPDLRRLSRAVIALAKKSKNAEEST